jgi:dinuclear metal center YbgI/SA1388 family protein
MTGPQAAEIAAWLDAELHVATTPDYSGAHNGLQVDRRPPVACIAAAVDASRRTIAAAIDAGAHLLIVHHGLFWGGAQPLRGVVFEKYAAMLESGLAVYSAHLPLDRHPVHGNNALLAQALGLSPGGEWLEYKGTMIGVTAHAEVTTATLTERARTFAASHGHALVATPFARDRISRHIAICSGGGASSESLRAAVAIGADTLIVGEGPHHTAVDAEELGLVVLYAGHYATETLGVQSIAAAVSARWQVPWSFIPAPTGR